MTLAPDGTGIWFATKERGVARWDIASGAWLSARAFAPDDIVASISAATASGFGRVPIDLVDESAFAAAFPVSDPWALIGDDPTRYRIVGYVPKRGSLGPFIDITPPLADDVATGTSVQRITRGPASDRSTRVVVHPDGGTVGGCSQEDVAGNRRWPLPILSGLLAGWWSRTLPGR